MPDTRQAARPGLIDRLAVRLVLLISLAMLPIGAVALTMALDSVYASQRTAERDLQRRAQDATAGKAALVERTRSAAALIAPLLPRRMGEPRRCATFIGDFLAEAPELAFAIVMDPAGNLVCSSGQGLPGGTDLSALRADFDDREPTLQVITTEDGAADGPSARLGGLGHITAVQPIRVGDTLTGFLLLAADRNALRNAAAPAPDDAPADALVPTHTALLNAKGEVLTMTGTVPAGGATFGAALPVSTTMPAPPILVGADGNGRILRSTDDTGQPVIEALVPLISGQLYGIARWPDTGVVTPLAMRSYLPFVFTALMWLASLGVVLLSLDHLLLRHLRNLNKQVRRFALGNREAFAELPADAPSELRHVTTTFHNMARIIARDEAQLEAALEEKTVLLKEIHHRVRNNLQLIASIINLQIRQLPDEQSRRVLRNVQDRVLGLATIHRHLYEEKQLSEVRADHVLQEILRQLVSARALPGQAPTLDVQFDAIPLPADRMVPLAFVMTEAVIASIGRMALGGERLRPWIDISLKRDAENDLLFEMRSAATPRGTALSNPEDDVSARIRDDLIRAFSSQLGGQLATGETEGERGQTWFLRLTMKDRVEPKDRFVTRAPS